MQRRRFLTTGDTKAAKLNRRLVCGLLVAVAVKVVASGRPLAGLAREPSATSLGWLSRGVPPS